MGNLSAETISNEILDKIHIYLVLRELPALQPMLGDHWNRILAENGDIKGFSRERRHDRIFHAKIIKKGVKNSKENVET